MVSESATTVCRIVVKGLGNNVLADYFWARAVVLTSPTVVAVGLSVTIPIAFASDFLLHGLVPDVLNACGAGLVICGFLCVNTAMARASRESEAEARLSGSS